MLMPALLYKEEITTELKKHIYESEMLFYSGWNGYNIPDFPDEFDGCNYQY